VSANIDLRVTADTQGAQATAASLDKVTAATEKLVDESERYQKALRQMSEAQSDAAMEADMLAKSAERRASLVSRQAGAAADAEMDRAEAAGYAAGADEELANSVKRLTAEDVRGIETTVKATGAKKSLFGVLQQLAREVPILGAAARMVMNPIVGVATAAAFAFGKLRNDLAALNASLTTSDWESYARVTEEGKKATEAAQIATAKYANDIERLATAQDTASQAADRLMTAQKAQMSAEERLDEARKRVELAQAGGEKDPAKRAERVLQIEEKYAARKLQREEQTSRYERNETYRKLANEEISAQVAGANLEKAKERAAALGSEAQITEKIRIERSRLAATEQELEAKTARIDELRGKFLLTTPQNRELSGLYGMTDSLALMRDRQRARVSALEAQAPGQIAAIRAAQGDVSQFEGAQKGAIERAEGIRRGLPTQEAVWGAEGRARRGVAELGSMERLVSAANQGVAMEKQARQQVHQSIVEANSEREKTIQALENVQSHIERINALLARQQRVSKDLINR
jgi:hypothetical protein